MIKGTVANLPGAFDDLQFGWQLSVSGITVAAIDMRWEQFVKGGFEMYIDTFVYRMSSKDTVPRHNAAARAFGAWIEDLVPNMPNGPKPLVVNTTTWGECRPSGGRAMEPRLECGAYMFDDTPGFEKNIGDTHTVGGLTGTVRGMRWNSSFQHKLWSAGQVRPFYVIEFTLSGGMGKDTGGNAIAARKIINVSHTIDEAMMAKPKGALQKLWWYARPTGL